MTLTIALAAVLAIAAIAWFLGRNRAQAARSGGRVRSLDRESVV